MKSCVLVSAVLLGSAALLSAGEKLTYVDLVNRLIDLDQLAELPLKGEQCAQWSSYDRKSRYDPASGKYVAWDANGDNDGVLRQEGNRFVFGEMEGPGCIWRIWSAAPKEGHVRIYLDGAAEPAVDLPFVGYFDQKNEPFTRPALVHTVAKGWNNYTPIPFQKSCRIVADPGWGAYYHFTYSTFPMGTRLPTFSRHLSKVENAALDNANRVLSSCGPRPAFSGDLSPFERVGFDHTNREVAHLQGPSAITTLRVKLDLPSGADAMELLRAITLQIRWDDEAAPSVWSPIGDFFGTAPGVNAYRSFPLGMGNDGWWYCNWVMPFAKSAEVTFQKETDAPVNLRYQIYARPLKGKESQYARFHAKWHRDAFLPTEPERWIDWPILKTSGTGRFVGVMLHIWNPRGSWWGEGDEKFFVDGEKFPSTFGTGSEDYFGYAWCNPGLFQNAYHNQTHNDGNNKGHVSVNRWHIPDNVPFQSGFEGCIEKYYRNDRPTLYASTAYWYLAPGGKDPYPPVPLADRVGYWTNVVSASRIPGVIEGEELKILARTGGEPQEQELTSFGTGWSNDAHLWWIDAKPKDKLDLGFPVKENGHYKLIMQMTKAPDYGVVQLYLDGQKLGEPVDLYAPRVVPSGVQSMGVHSLTAGQHKLTAEIMGANAKAIKRYMFGLDYLKLERQ